MAESGPASAAPLTVNQLFTRTVEQFGDRTALGWKDGEQWRQSTYRDYYRDCRIAAKSFLKVSTESDAGCYPGMISDQHRAVLQILVPASSIR